MSPFSPIIDNRGERIPWADAAARARGAFRSPPQRSDLVQHEADLVPAAEIKLRDEIRTTVRKAVEAGLPAGRARTAGLVGVAVECMALRAEAENERRRARG